MIFTDPNDARMNLCMQNDSTFHGNLNSRRLNYTIATSQSQQDIFDMVSFSGEWATDEAHLHLNHRISTHNCTHKSGTQKYGTTWRQQLP